MSLGNVFNIAGSGMSAQSIRLNTVASNISNAQSVSSSIDSTYRSRQPVFQVLQKEYIDRDFSELDLEADIGNGVKVAGIVESDAPLQVRYEPAHPMSNEDGYVYYPNVNVVEEMTNMISSSRSFQTNVEVLNTAKQMMQKVLTLGQ